jgi:hypothetical protein
LTGPFHIRSTVKATFGRRAVMHDEDAHV